MKMKDASKNIIPNHVCAHEAAKQIIWLQTDHIVVHLTSILTMLDSLHGMATPSQRRGNTAQHRTAQSTAITEVLHYSQGLTAPSTDLDSPETPTMLTSNSLSQT